MARKPTKSNSPPVPDVYRKPVLVDGGSGGMKPDSDPIKKEQDAFKEAESRRKNWEDIWQDCYSYAMPNREGFYEETTGDVQTQDIYDSTAVHAVPEFASRIQAGVTPVGSNWAQLKPGPDFEIDSPEQLNEVQAALELVELDLFSCVQNSNFDSESDEAYQELAIGTATVMVEDGGIDAPFKFTALPATQIWINQGPFGDVAEVFRRHKVRAGEIQFMWPDAVLSSEQIELRDNQPRKPLVFVEGTRRDYNVKAQETYTHRIWEEKKDSFIVNKLFKGEGSNPFLTFRWQKSAGEAYGRGPLIKTLPDIKTINLVIQMVLENAEKALSGMWQTDDDSLNVDNINFVPGTILPISPGSDGLKPLEAPGRLDFAQFLLDDMRFNIRKGLYSEPLGPPAGTPFSATEATQRLAELSRILSSPIGRMVSEWVRPLIRRLLFIRRAQGKINLPILSGRVIKIIPISPLAKVADQEKILAIDRFLEMVLVRFGPQMMNMIVDGAQAADELADLLEVPKKLIRDPQTVAALGERLMALQQDPSQASGGLEQAMQQVA
jgi:hypothetical protein